MSVEFRLRGCHPLWPAFPRRSAILRLSSRYDLTLQPLYGSKRTGLGFSHFARHYFGNILFSSGYLDVSVPPVPFFTLLVHVKMTEVRSVGFPHSDISGSAPVHGSPELFAVSHVLHRHSAPRHPP